ncbi:helix-turn-helix transcriptional regulator [Planctomycetota bacterium]
MRQEKENRNSDNSQSIAISAKQLSQLLGVSIRQVWRLSATAKLPKNLRLGGSVKWSRAEIIQWFEAGCPDRQTWDAMNEVHRAR